MAKHGRVSIPHRYAENSDQFGFIGIQLPFQSLIGMLKTCYIRANQFQVAMFQSLIGMLKTRNAVALFDETWVVSIPHRYAENVS